jgi:hypothetical protein
MMAPYLDPICIKNRQLGRNSRVPNPQARCEEETMALLQQGISSLNQLASCPQEGLEQASLIRQLRDLLRKVEDPAFSWSRSDQYRIVHPMTAWMNRYNLSYVSISERRTHALASLAHFFAAAIALDLAFSAMKHPVLSVIREKSILEIDSILRDRPPAFCESCKCDHGYQDLMSFPLNTVRMFRQKYS